MAPIVYSVEIARSPEDVFAYLSDPSRYGEWQENVVSASIDGGGPLRQGARLSMTRRIGGGTRTFLTEITEYDAPRRQAFRGIAGPVRPSGNATIEPLEGGARSRLTFELDFEGKGLGILLVPVIRRQAAREVPASHEKLKQRLESGAV